MTQNTDVLVGRKKEQIALRQIVESGESEFVVVYGRRRVGKTFLVNNYFKDEYAFKLTGFQLYEKYFI